MSKQSLLALKMLRMNYFIVSLINYNHFNSISLIKCQWDRVSDGFLNSILNWKLQLTNFNFTDPSPLSPPEKPSDTQYVLQHPFPVIYSELRNLRLDAWNFIFDFFQFYVPLHFNNVETLQIVCQTMNLTAIDCDRIVRSFPRLPNLMWQWIVSCQKWQLNILSTNFCSISSWIHFSCHFLCNGMR